MRKVIFVAQTDETRRKEALETLDEIMEVIRERAEKLIEVMNNDVLTCLSDTHRQLASDLGEVELDTEYELIGTIDGTYAGRWMLAAFAENASSVWPDGTAVYVRRGKESTTEEPLNLDSFASSYPGEFKESLVELNQKPSTLWETMRLDDEWKARLEAAVLDEREACARVCDEQAAFWPMGSDEQCEAEDCAYRIRTRGQE